MVNAPTAVSNDPLSEAIIIPIVLPFLIFYMVCADHLPKALQDPCQFAQITNFRHFSSDKGAGKKNCCYLAGNIPNIWHGT
jgi:hypothetical protein